MDTTITDKQLSNIVTGALREIFNRNRGTIPKKDIGAVSKAVTCQLMGHIEQLRSRDFIVTIDEKVKEEFFGQLADKDRIIKKLANERDYWKSNVLEQKN